jgi:hypothetical protein
MAIFVVLVLQAVAAQGKSLPTLHHANALPCTLESKWWDTVGWVPCRSVY